MSSVPQSKWKAGINLRIVIRSEPSNSWDLSFNSICLTILSIFWSTSTSWCWNRSANGIYNNWKPAVSVYWSVQWQSDTHFTCCNFCNEASQPIHARYGQNGCATCWILYWVQMVCTGTETFRDGFNNWSYGDDSGTDGALFLGPARIWIPKNLLVTTLACGTLLNSVSVSAFSLILTGCFRQTLYFQNYELFQPLVQ